MGVSRPPLTDSKSAHESFADRISSFESKWQNITRHRREGGIAEHTGHEFDTPRPDDPPRPFGGRKVRDWPDPNAFSGLGNP